MLASRARRACATVGPTALGSHRTGDEVELVFVELELQGGSFAQPVYEGRPARRMASRLHRASGPFRRCHETLGELLPSARLCSYVEAFACPAAGRQFTGRSLWAGHRGEPVLTDGVPVWGSASGAGGCGVGSASLPGRRSRGRPRTVSNESSLSTMSSSPGPLAGRPRQRPLLQTLRGFTVLAKPSPLAYHGGRWFRMGRPEVG